MRHQTVDAHVAKLVQAADEIAQLIETHAEPPHAGVDLNVRIHDPAREPDYDARVRIAIPLLLGTLSLACGPADALAPEVKTPPPVATAA